jgi:ATP-dependent protease Clp ATPase subunit
MPRLKKIQARLKCKSSKELLVHGWKDIRWLCDENRAVKRSMEQLKQVYGYVCRQKAALEGVAEIAAKDKTDPKTLRDMARRVLREVRKDLPSQETPIYAGKNTKARGQVASGGA